jgi:FtsH-binding integral membrane protein
MHKVYGWMAAGLALTAGASYYIAQTDFVQTVTQNTGLLIVLFLLQIGLVIYLSAFIQTMSLSMARFSFILYSFLNGVTLASIFLVYTQESIASTFLITAGMFATMAIYGYVTKTDLTGMGNFLLMALFGLIIAMVVNMFLQSASMQYVISACGVIIFTLLTAYDVQKIKQLGQTLEHGGEFQDKVVIIGALTLYLDFINLFLYLLQFMGKKKE